MKAIFLILDSNQNHISLCLVIYFNAALIISFFIKQCTSLVLLIFFHVGNGKYFFKGASSLLKA